MVKRFFDSTTAYAGAAGTAKNRVGQNGRVLTSLSYHRSMTNYEWLINELVTYDFTDDCVEWPHYIRPDGYAYVRHEGEKVGVHRAALEHRLGRAVQENHYALHHCDNRKCFNPKHLYEGTHADNMADMVQRERVSRIGMPGVKHPKSKLSEDQVLEIRSLHNTVSGVELAKRFGVTPSAINGIKSGKRWKHI